MPSPLRPNLYNRLKGRLGPVEIKFEGEAFMGRVTWSPMSKRLCLGHNRIGDEGVALLVSSPRLSRLRVLHLTLTGLGAEGVRALAGSPLMSRLRVLTMGMNQLPPGC
jgi:hypothetical protein